MRQTSERPAVDDSDVIDRSLRDPSAFAELFERHVGEIGRYVTRRVGPGVAEDIVGETFLVAFRRRAAYDRSRTNARPWLYGIATNVIRRHRRDEVRALKALQRTGADPVLADAGSFADQVDGRVSASATSRALAPVLAGLDAGQRDVLLLTAWADLTLDEVAEVLGIPPGTARSRLNRARTKIRSALEKKENRHG
ncbi:RNA polymerase sigma factor [Actinomadura rupiterrae]|uniref:RNA polymerase sigma factor n=1 Tax=Actinomadura rupiterrae TaxID=559627 RepID=UPI0020A536E9|nr:RNA polymerase sigma factor [Actinomadura rupiterrae]MCP2341040.1 RNA polymerase sigma-70 factor (ECF subfamily) [Actinomadura rupiterrae]